MDWQKDEPFYAFWNVLDIIIIFIFATGIVFPLDLLLYFLGVNEEAVLRTFIFGVTQASGFIFFTWVIISRGGNYNFYLAKFKRLDRIWLIIILSILLWVTATFIYSIIQIIIFNLTGLAPQPQSVIDFVVENVRGAYFPVYAFLLVILAPLSEEIFFRGVLYPFLRARIGVNKGAILSSLLFAVAHGEVWAIIPTFFAGLGFVFFLEKTKTLWAPVVAHIIWNSMGLGIVYLAIF